MIRSALLSLALAAPALADQPVPGSVPQAMTDAEKAAFRASVQDCWNVGGLSDQARAAAVTVAFQVGSDRRPLAGTIRLAGQRGAADAVAQACETARRAVLRFGHGGLDLLPEKHAHWADVEITFDGAAMR